MGNPKSGIERRAGASTDELAAGLRATLYRHHISRFALSAKTGWTISKISELLSGRERISEAEVEIMTEAVQNIRCAKINERG
jgi:hypothetical protein